MLINNHRRWYDQDPALSIAMQTLERADDKEQIMLALHLIKIINEHKIEDALISPTGDVEQEGRMSRWYDVDKTLRISIEMLRRCPEPVQRVLAHQIVSELKAQMEKDAEQPGLDASI